MTRSRPSLTTARLLLRGFELADAHDVQGLAGDRDVAATTLRVPHPYEDGMAETWISGHVDAFARGEELSLAITDRSSDTVVGAIGLKLFLDDDRAELGYWIGKPFWGRAYATEAARAVVGYGFGELGLHRIHASTFSTNPASSRVLEKLGMRDEGLQRRHIKKWGEYVDVRNFGVLREEWEA